jgi:enoyl-CoA hydratase/carnithine racemase
MEIGGFMLVELIGLRDHIAVLQLNDKAKRNALSPPLIDDFLVAIDKAGTDGARAIVVTGSERYFCAGADINGLRDNHWLDVQPTGTSPYDLFQRIEREPRLVIGAVQGLALGGGFEFLLCCDLVVAGSEASFGLPEVGLGVMPNAGIARLAEICGTRRALEIILTKRRIDAQEASSLGIANTVVPGAGVVDAAVALARQIVGTSPPAAIAAVKQAMRGLNGATWPDIQSAISLLDAREWQEGLSSFLERRAVDFEPFWDPGKG